MSIFNSRWNKPAKLVGQTRKALMATDDQILDVAHAIFYSQCGSMADWSSQPPAVHGYYRTIASAAIEALESSATEPKK